MTTTIHTNQSGSLGLPDWTLDCQGKQDWDGALVELSTRYWPGNYQLNGKVSTKCSILLAGETLVSKEFEADSELQVKAMTEAWARAQLDEIVQVLRSHLQQ